MRRERTLRRFARLAAVFALLAAPALAASALTDASVREIGRAHV